MSVSFERPIEYYVAGEIFSSAMTLHLLLEVSSDASFGNLACFLRVCLGCQALPLPSLPSQSMDNMSVMDFIS